MFDYLLIYGLFYSPLPDAIFILTYYSIFIYIRANKVQSRARQINKKCISKLIPEYVKSNANLKLSYLRSHCLVVVKFLNRSNFFKEFFWWITATAGPVSSSSLNFRRYCKRRRWIELFWRRKLYRPLQSPDSRAGMSPQYRARFRPGRSRTYAALPSLERAHPNTLPINHSR